MNTPNKSTNKNTNPINENTKQPIHSTNSAAPVTLRYRLTTYAAKYKYYIIFTFVLLSYQFIIREYRGDAVKSFSAFLNEKGLIDTLIERYELWTSRIIVEIPLIIISKNMSVGLWRIADMAVMLILMRTIMKMTQIRDKYPQYLLLGLMILFPYQILQSAGWIATTMNYTWPATALVVSLMSLKKLYDGDKINVAEGIIYIILLVYGTNFETLGIVHIGIAVIVAIYMICDRNMTPLKGMYIALQILISIANIVFSLTCPGNWNRNTTESYNRMRDIGTMTFADKLTLGVNDTFSNLIDHNAIFLVFAVMLIVLAIYSTRTNKYIKLLSAAPLVIVLSRTIGYQIMASYWENYNKVFDDITKMDATKFQNPNAYAPFILYMGLFIIILVVILSSIEDIRTAVTLCVVLGTTMLTRVAMGFSPTIYASGDRTFTFLIIGMMYCIIRMYQEVRDNIYVAANPNTIRYTRYVWTAFIFLAFVGNLIGIGAGR